MPPAAFAYESLDLVLQLATNGSTKALHGGHVYTFEVPTGPCDATAYFTFTGRFSLTTFRQKQVHFG